MELLLKLHGRSIFSFRNFFEKSFLDIFMMFRGE